MGSEEEELQRESGAFLLRACVVFACFIFLSGEGGRRCGRRQPSLRSPNGSRTTGPAAVADASFPAASRK